MKRTAVSRSPRRAAPAAPRRTAARQRGPGEDGVLHEEAVREERLPAVALVGEGVRHLAHGLEPGQVLEVPLLGAVLGDDEEVDVGVLVEAVVLGAGGPGAQDGDDVVARGQVGGQPVEPVERGMDEAALRSKVAGAARRR